MNLNIPGKMWRKDRMPRRILAIRLQAMGDLVITLPYLQQLKNSMPPGTRLDLLTRTEVEAIPRKLDLFDKVWSIGGGRNTKLQLTLTALMLPALWFRRYEVVIDLQNNIVSKLARKCLLPQAWSEFDRFSPIAAGESTRLTIEAIGLGKCNLGMGQHFRLKHEQDAIDATGLLKANGWDTGKALVVLNPAGAFHTRNWEKSNYAQFARLWLKQYPDTQFLILGTAFIAAKADWLAREMGPHLINLIGKTTPAGAFTILQQTTLVLSEDSGLMHMAWVSGIPTLALFGSTRSDRARPLGDRALLLDSSDLTCGNCMLRECPYGDPPCLSRYTPELVFEKAVKLLHACNQTAIPTDTPVPAAPGEASVKNVYEINAGKAP
jgi:lipopolysaccharide heptosyltransferase II